MRGNSAAVVFGVLLSLAAAGEGADPQQARLSRLKVMVCVGGTLTIRSEKPVDTGVARSALEETLRAEGWQVVPSQPLASTAPEDIAATVKLEPADLIIVGTEALTSARGEPGAVIQEIDPVTGRQRVFLLDAAYDFSIIDTVSKKSIGNVKASHLDHARPSIDKIQISYEYTAKEYARLVALQVVPALRDAALTMPERSVELTLTVENLKPADAAAFVAWCKTLPQLKTIAVRGQAFVVTPKGTMMELGTALDGARFKGHAISVGKVSATEIGATLSK